MTTRTDVTVLYHLSPRLIIVDAPSTEITMQDLHDTLSNIDDEPVNMVYPKLLSTAGKEDLGGGVKVGITVTLQNAQIAFRRRGDQVGSSGAITTASVPGGAVQLVIDSSATFVSDGVQPGYFVYNETDASDAEIVSIDSETQLTVLAPTLGTDNDYDVSDTYIIQLVETCNLSGGNLVAVDTDGVSPIQPTFPTYGVQINKTSSASATLQEQLDIQYASFNGGITVDLTSSNVGTDYPTGTPRLPVNNFTDALSMAAERGFTTFFVVGDALIDSGLVYNGITFVGESMNKSEFTISASADVTNSEFTSATVQGTLDGGNVLNGCALLDINYVDGYVESCVLKGIITLSGAGDAFLLDCWSGVPGTSTPEINMGGSGSGLAIRNYSGGIEITNRTGTDPVSIDMNSGQIVINNTVIAGTLTLRGVAKWSNETTYTGGATIVNELIESEIEDGLTLTQAMRVIFAACGSKSSGLPSGPIKFRDYGDAKDRISATFDANSNRLTVTYDLTK